MITVEFWRAIRGNWLMIITAALLLAVAAGVWNWKCFTDGRRNAVNTLTINYYLWPEEMAAERERLMQLYRITEDEIKPSNVLGITP